MILTRLFSIKLDSQCKFNLSKIPTPSQTPDLLLDFIHFKSIPLECIMKLLFSVVFMMGLSQSVKAEMRNPEIVCSALNLTFSSSKEKCKSATDEVGFVNENAILICSKFSFDDGKLKCLEIIKSKKYRNSELLKCQKEAFESSKTECLESSGVSVGGYYGGGQQSARKVCESLMFSFSSDVDKCKNALEDSFKFVNPEAKGICAKMDSTRDKLVCIQAVINKELSFSDLSECDSKSFDSSKNSCFEKK